MVVRSYPDVGSAAEQLAKTAMVWEDRRALIKQSGAMNVQSIAQWMKNNPLLAGSLLGASGGGLYGLLTSLGREEEDRSPLQSAMTGALGGGLLGLGGGAIYKYGPELYSRYFGDKAKAPTPTAATPEHTEIWNKITSGELNPQDVLKSKDPAAIQLMIEAAERATPQAATPATSEGLFDHIDYLSRGLGLTGGEASSAAPLQVPADTNISDLGRRNLEQEYARQVGGISEANLPPGGLERIKQVAPIGAGAAGLIDLGRFGLHRAKNRDWMALQRVAEGQGGKGPHAEAMQQIAESPATAKSMVSQSRRSERPARPERPPPTPLTPSTRTQLRRMLTGEGMHPKIRQPWVTPQPPRPERPAHIATMPGGQAIEAAHIRAKVQAGRAGNKPFKSLFKGKTGLGLGGLLTIGPGLWGAHQEGKARKLQEQQMGLKP